MGTRPDHDVADLGLAEVGQARVEWADARMPVLRSIRERFAREQPLAGVRVAVCLHVTTETANLVRALSAGGAEVALCASNPLSTQDDVAAALVDRYDASVHAIQGEDMATYYDHIEHVVDTRPQITMDDGADVISVIHSRRTELLGDIVGGTEETTSGVLRLRALESQGKLGFPVVAVGEAQTKRFFDDRYGTGQSTLDGILRATNTLLAGRVVVVFGYGWCGRGIALRARGAGSQVVVCEVDPLRALEAKLDGFEVMPALAAAAKGDVFVTATGGRDVVRREHYELMRDGALLCNAGHFDVELNLADLRAVAPERRVVREHVEQHVTPDGRRLHLLAQGRVVNLAAAEGHPAAVMDVAFANQALAAEYLVRHAHELRAGVIEVPRELDHEISRLTLASLGVEIDALTAGQQEYLTAWEIGT
ncbi:adenosylhomocysteinase [Conexibacter woesei]|uniref:Adenosylhomocysteinase n=1 Tax=Conexibacter woesei (strain DSM 14684 / CCUG 47730 / CIP 108061 / JCM 11494 / NBRC 100937 / ID131577) TaxID=469383 RepID=D3F927_CONWI|nr:adenosylhomocysteinase [Conexibacter woesei]ADB53022.1 adenosylhomocysteinase [Conexibacter woesei DSM 14684]